MAKIRGPLLSLGASGQIAGSQVYSTWKGVRYARQLVAPANPQTADQQQTRSVFAFLQDLYRNMPSSVTQIWDEVARGRPLTPRNAITKSNLPDLRQATDLSDLVLSPGVRNAPIPTNVNITTGAGAGQITVQASLAPLPTGWTATQWIVTAVRNQDPHNPFLGEFFVYGTAATTNLNTTITVQQPATAYSVGVIEQFQTNTGAAAWSADLRTIVTSG